MGKPSRDRTNLKICLLLAVVTLAVYWQVSGFQFCYYDDNIYVADNDHVKNGLTLDTLKWAFTTNYMGNWHPLTWLSYSLDTEMARPLSWFIDTDMGQGNPEVYHLSNAVLHALNTVILFLVLFELTGLRWRSAFVAALFGLHPLHVESAAWIAERKDVLSTLFWFLTMWAYLKWARRPRARNYAIMMVAFLLGLMSKAMLVSLPVVLLLLDFWPLRRFEWLSLWNGSRASVIRLVREKLPLFGLSAVFSVVAFWAQNAQGLIGTMQDFPFWVRALNAFSATTGYLWKMVRPVNLAPLYTHPGTHIPILGAVFAGLVIIAATVIAVKLRRRAPYLTVGWLWYLITLLPVIGFVQIGIQSMADRYTHVPLVGVFIALTWAVPDLLSVIGSDRVRQAILTLAAIGILVALIPITYAQIGVWRTPELLFKHTIAVTENNAPAMNNYALVLEDQGEMNKSLLWLRRALRADPDYVDARFNLGNALFKNGNFAEAEGEFKRVIRECPRYPYAHMRLGDIYSGRYQFRGAIGEYKLALREIPDSAPLWSLLGICYAKSSRFTDAIRCFERAVKLDPELAQAQDNLDRAREQLP